MQANEKNSVIANLIDIDNDGKIEMISFMNDKGSIGLAVNTEGLGKTAQVYLFQDVTGDGVLDQDDEIKLRDTANALFEKYMVEPPQQITIVM